MNARLTTLERGVIRSGTAVVTLVLLAFAAALAVVFLRVPWDRPPRGESETASAGRGGTLVASLRSEPRTFNSYIGRDFATEVITHLTQATLVRVNRVTQELEPRLAERWDEESTDKGVRYVLRLRQDVRFSDGAPFSADDLLFAFRAAYDQKTGSPLADSLLVQGKPLTVEAVDPHTVRLTFPSRFGPGLRMLDRFPILPRHRLEKALNEGTLRSAWSVGTPPSEITGLGPFRLTEYQPGQRLVFARNPHYWRRDSSGAPLPYLDAVRIEIVPDQNAELLRLQAGEIDFTQSEARAEDISTLKRAADQGRIRLVDLGVGLDADALWFNLRGGERPASDRAWWIRAEFRRAVSHAVNRGAFADTVFLGAAVPIFGVITPANREWYNPDLPRYDYDPEQAKRLLAGLGLTDRNGDGRIDDPSGRQAGFVVLTQRGNTALERGATFVRDELARVGLVVEIVPLEVGALVERLMTGKYDAIFFRFLMQATDPGLNLDFWMSKGGAHVWHPEQTRPVTEWERRIDELMLAQASTLDQAERKRLFDEAQRVLAEEQPILYFAAPRVFVAMNRRVVNAQPSVMRPNLLWNADSLAVQD
ncbi:MAG: ABC transporter substrate-binding protein [Acidobacteria bacterium]|nr:ABC transporter substrate-binding protein [Acidobacteriota bacterium]